MDINLPELKRSFEICKKTATELLGHDDPQFKRIHHCFHHVNLYIKDYLLKEDCKNYLEIGTHFGHSLSVILQSQYPTKAVSIDLFEPWGDTRVKDMFKLANENASKFNINNYKYHIIKGNSNELSTIRKVSDHFPNGIDLLFIDGDHSYQGITEDFKNYYPLIRNKGYIVFDDYLPLGREATKAIDDIALKFKNEIIDYGCMDDVLDTYSLKSETPIFDKKGNKKNIERILKKK